VSKYENNTLNNFKVTILWTILNRKPRSRTDLLQTLNNLDNDDIKSTLKLKSDISAKDWIVNKELGLTESFSNPFYAYKQQKISLFSINDYYNRNADKVKGRIMRKEIQMINTFVNLIGGD